MRLIVLAFRMFGFWVTFSLPVTIPLFLYHGESYSVVALAAFLVFFLLDSFFSYSWIRKNLAAKTDVLFGTRVCLFSDKKATFLLSAHPFRRGITLWVNEGVFSLLPSEDLKTLFRKFDQETPRKELIFETYLSFWIYRFSLAIPKKNRAWISATALTREKRTIQFPLWSIFWFGCIYILKAFLSRPAFFKSENSEELRLIQRVQSWSFSDGTCTPEAFENLSVVPLFKEALLHYGRTCLWQKDELGIY